MSDHRDRYRQIADTLSRHGLGYLVGVLGLERRVPFHRGLRGHEVREEPYTQPEHVGPKHSTKPASTAARSPSWRLA